MRVYYDYQAFFMQKFGGISRYFFELITCLEAMGVNVSFNCIHNHNYYLSKRLGVTEQSKNIILRGIEYKLCAYINRKKALSIIKNSEYDIIHPTYYHPYMLSHYSGKLVITVYDMIHEKYASKYPILDNKDIINKKRMIYAADRIIAISKSTKHDILNFYPDIDEKRISVVYLASSIACTKKVRLLPEPYVLFVGNRSLYKNFNNFLKSILPILNKYRDLHVLCVGGGMFSASEIDLMKKYKNRFHQISLSDDDISSAYTNAECFVFPSEYEGFGIPILEAFACQCPVVLSNVSSMPEIAGNAAEYFTPLHIESMTEKILNVLEDSMLRNILKKNGTERLKKFSWEITAKKTLDIYKSMLS